MKLITISLISVAVLIVGALLLTKNETNDSISNNNVKIVDGTQIIDLRAKGGYSPRKSVAKAGIPTILKVNTSGTFDCSSSIRIPSLKISQNLPPSGSTEIDLGTPSVGILEGACGMGMYPFEIDFQS